MSEKVTRSDAEWRRLLNSQQYRVLRQHDTERPFTGEYHACKDEGLYQCAGCGQPLFGSETKFDSGTGWPSFWTPVEQEAVGTRVDVSHGMRRVEVHCSRCEGHLGHIFDDGPKPTGLRYCINSAALRLDPGKRGT